MTVDKKPIKKKQDKTQIIEDLTADLQRTRADFENFRKRADAERSQAVETGKMSAVSRILPLLDDIERALAHRPAELGDNPWALGVEKLVKSFDKSLENLGLSRIQSTPGTHFDPEVHHAVQMEDGDGDQDVIVEELQPGYRSGDQIVRPALVKVGKV